MPTYVITDDTNSICISVSGQAKNIDKDNAVLRIIPAGTGLNTTTIDQLSIEHDGHFATRIPYNDVTVSGVSPVSVSDFRTKVLTILNNNGSSNSTPITVDYLTLAQLGADSEVIEGQAYKYVDATFLPASIDHILLTGSGTQTYNNIGQAYVTAIGKYVQCDYDLATNDISGEYVLWCADLDQSGESDPTISILHKNISGETPTLTYIGYGEYSITFTNDQLVSVSNCDKISGLIEEPSFAFTGYASDSNTFTLKTFSSGGQSNGIFLKTTIKIIIQLKPN